MSRLPPLPPGLPSKPGPPPRSYGDSYRPGAPVQNVDNYPHNGNREPMYQFRGSHDSQPAQYQRQRSPHSYSYAPGTVPPRGPFGDSYRPQEREFDFRHEPPPSLDFRQPDSYRPRSPPRQRNYAEANNRNVRQDRHFDGQRNQVGTRGGYRGRGGPRYASDRAFLKGNRAPTPELMAGMDDVEGSTVRYRAIEDMSDSDEADMDVSDIEGSHEGDEQRRKKQARSIRKATDGDSIPQWSNPDPYTALPPPDESQRKKKDVVKLIRKARVIASSESTVAAKNAADDFISFDFGDDPEEEEDDDDDDRYMDHNGDGVAGAPTGPRYSHRDYIQKLDVPTGPKTLATKAPESRVPEAGIYSIKAPVKPEGSLGFKVLDLSSEPSLGNRKRTIRDEIKGPPLIHKSTKGRPPRASGTLLSEWKVPVGSTGIPWLGIDHSDTAKMGVWLHKEIVDFYHYVKPTDFEQVIRTKLVEDLRIRLREEFKDADIRCFGSFPAGLYLPTADMDLVCVSDQFMRGGRRIYGQDKKDIRRFHRFVERHNLAIPGSIELIFGAKVPLVKYVDRLTGLKVDISFENDTGLIANKTFQDWRAQFPAMPILVTLIKQLLAMRGLNEPVNGGIGGFSVTCLVVSLLQNMPQVQSRTMVPEHHLGEVLMEFLDLYGHEFNTTTTAIQFDPPGYVSKAYNREIVYKQANRNRISIIDPNNPSNDIAGGSSNTETVLKCLSQAYIALQKRMGDLQYSANRRNQSILGCILAGDYSSFELQREHLAHIHEKLFGLSESN